MLCVVIDCCYALQIEENNSIYFLLLLTKHVTTHDATCDEYHVKKSKFIVWKYYLISRFLFSAKINLWNIIKFWKLILDIERISFRSADTFTEPKSLKLDFLDSLKLLIPSVSVGLDMALEYLISVCLFRFKTDKW